MRFEGKHRYFKRLARIGNWVNPLKSLAQRHEKLQTLLYAVEPGHLPPNVLVEMEVGEPFLVEMNELQEIYVEYPHLPQVPNLYSRYASTHQEGSEGRKGSQRS